MPEPPGSPTAPRRVLYYEVCEDGTVGGSHQQLANLVRALDPARYRPTVVFYQDNRFARQLRDEGFDVEVWEARRSRERRAFPAGSHAAKGAAHLGAILWRIRRLRALGIEVVHGNNSPLMGHDDWLPAARALGAACLTQAVGEPYRPPAGRLARRLATGWDRILAVSEHVAGELVSGGFPADRVETVVAGIDVADFVGRARRDPAELRRELGVGDDELWVLMVGNLRPWKGQDRVVDALARLGEPARERLRVGFVGVARAEDAEYVARLEAAVEAAGWQPRVQWLGVRDDVPDLTRAADLVVHASTFPEPFGLVVVEALALGKPVVAANRGGPLEILREGSGLLHDPDRPEQLASHLQRLVADPELRARLGENARRRAAELDSHRAAARIQDLYDELRARPGRGEPAPAEPDPRSH